MKLVLSNTTTFFSGSMESAFKKAKRSGYRYMEIVPYRWTSPEQILTLEEKYKIEVVGIHLPTDWDLKNQTLKNFKFAALYRIFKSVWYFYLGDAKTSSGWNIARTIKKTKGRNPYVLLHSNVVKAMGKEFFEKIKNEFHIVIENIPAQMGQEKNLWDPGEIKRLASVVFDAGHFLQSKEIIPKADIVKAWEDSKPEILHISFIHSLPIFGWHVLPNQEEQKLLKKMLAIHKPEYIIVETNPAVKPKKAKKLLESIITNLS